MVKHLVVVELELELEFEVELGCQLVRPSSLKVSYLWKFLRN